MRIRFSSSSSHHSRRVSCSHVKTQVLKLTIAKHPLKMEYPWANWQLQWIETLLLRRTRNGRINFNMIRVKLVYSRIQCVFTITSSQNVILGCLGPVIHVAYVASLSLSNTTLPSIYTKLVINSIRLLRIFQSIAEWIPLKGAEFVTYDW